MRSAIAYPRKMRWGVTRSGYDARYRLVVLTDTLGNATRFIYDANNNQTGTVDPLGRTTPHCLRSSESSHLLDRFTEPDDAVSI